MEPPLIVRRARRKLAILARGRVPFTVLYRRGLRQELRWWRRYIVADGAEWSDEYLMRMDPDAPLGERLIADRLDRFPGPAVSILDVGAGPFTILGKRHPAVELQITAVDPLADAYAEMLAELGVTPPLRTLRCAGEEVAERFGSDRFDVVYARNALDHGRSPAVAIRAMLEVVRPGGFVALRHHPREAEKTAYAQLHNWNFDAVDGALMVWGPYGRHDLTRELENQGTVSCWIEDDDGPWVCAVIDKHPEAT